MNAVKRDLNQLRTFQILCGGNLYVWQYYYLNSGSGSNLSMW